MTDDPRFDDLYDRINEMTLDIANLKIRANTAGNTQVTVAEVLNMTITLTRHMREAKADIRELKGDVRELKADVQILKGDVQELKADVRDVKADISEILRLLRDRNQGSE